MRFSNLSTTVNRRSFLRVGALGCAGLTTADLLRAEATAGPRPAASAAIVLFLDGGPSHIDTFDMKPEAPAEYRGEFRPISTKTPGVQICEHLPKLAACSDKYSLVRGISHKLADHGLAKKYVITGNRPLSSLEYPEFGCALSEQLPAAPDIPGHIAIPRSIAGAGFLGLEHASFETHRLPDSRRISPEEMTLVPRVPLVELQNRRSLLARLDQRFSALQHQEPLIDSMDRFSTQAFDILCSSRTREAFQVDKEAPSFSKLFTSDPISQSCLLATRLVEAGVRCVTISFGGWDTHDNNFGALRKDLLPQLDNALASLLHGLTQRGLLDSTAVLVTGEFGRTPKISKGRTSAGRDHHSACMFALLAGGGFKGGRLVGSSDSVAAHPLDDPLSPDDLAASLYHSLGVDLDFFYQTDSGRPIRLVRHGRPIKDLLS